MSNFEISPLNEGQHPHYREIIRQGLYQYNREQTGSREFVDLALVALGQDDRVLGGILGGSIWGWMLIDTLWVSDEMRGQGLGSALLAEAEAVARLRGCKHVVLETFSFQALPFYQSRGYLIYGRLDDFPPGHSRFSLKKDLL
jgi:GNAT superfamily N-acetyltransferase